MIIKSMSRSSMSFAQLYDYLSREDNSEISSYNLFSSPHDKEGIIKEFMQNASHLKRSRGRNYLYHEILSLKKSKLSLEQQGKILKDLTEHYLSQRATDHLCFISLHKDKEHTHVHLMISANEIAAKRRTRLSKKDFALIQKNAECYISEKYPELEKSEHYQQPKTAVKKSRPEQELKNRTKKPTKKEELIAKLRDIFEKTTNESYFANTLKTQAIEFYTRGKTKGVVFEGKKYRLKTLGLELEYNQLLKKLERAEIRKEKRQKQKTDSKAASRRKEMRDIRQHQNKESEKER